MARHHRTLTLLALFAVAAIESCFAEPGPVEPYRPGRGDSGSERGGDGGVEISTGGTDMGVGGQTDGGGPACPPVRELDDRARCRSLESSEPLLGRIPDPEATEQSVFTSELYGMLRTNCGACHFLPAASGDPPFQITPDNMAEVVDREVLAIIRSDEAEIVMPPPPIGRPFNERRAGDRVRKLADWLQTWLDQGSPKDVFVLPAELAGQSPYVYDEAFAQTMSNIGSCVPDAGLVATDTERSCELDARFADLEKSTDPNATEDEWLGLPPTLDQTDLTTFDSEALAKQGVISFAPAYPLWSDGAGKMRHVRVPRGESIRFDKRKQEFVIPPNTRFYKTFLKQIVDKDGVSRMKKMETRIIVSRPDRLLEDGTHEVTALFGTYVWNPQETRADLLTDGQRDGKPFADRVVKYITDEPKAAEVLAGVRPGRDKDLALRDARVIRHYAIPGRQRCVQCHMGSPSASFVLGFTPMQIHRRPQGEGGVYEPAGPDELTQLERLIDYGVITGVEATGDIVLLEDSQGDRHPRNDYELKAQAYMFGNCAHCHNPLGFPSVSAPELRDMLDFWPRRDGGIFEFPLDRMSPRIKRGKEGDVPIPYITPSLRDSWPEPKYQIAPPYTPKIFTEPNANGTINFMDAPWRSLIYRNVDTPFIYSDDYAIFPHMPRNTAGYDCRAPRILAEWMVSIPAKRINSPALFNENGVPAWHPFATPSFDNLPQPYAEVLPDDPQYADAVEAAEARLQAYREGERYSYCVDQTDIMDRNVLDGPRPTPFDVEVQNAPTDGVPDRVHWTFVDETEAGGQWSPRRLDWKVVLLDRMIPEVTLPTSHPNYWPQKITRDAQVELVDLLQDITLDSIRNFALSAFPMGRWQVKEDCDFSSVRKVNDLPEPRPRWAETLRQESGNVPLYEVLPGEAIFNMICVNCHGPNADSKGPIAQTLAEMTGDLSRVANFRSGLFGTNDEGVMNRDLECPTASPNCSFGGALRASSLGITSQDLAGRYMAWMALGGTNAVIPPDILNMVANTEVLGLRRTGAVGTTNLSANMLSVGKDLCEGVLGRPGTGQSKIFAIQDGVRIDWSRIYSASGLILQNGDAELWEKLCNLNNPSPVRALYSAWDDETPEFTITELYKRAPYPASAPVGNQIPRIENGIRPENHFPWCILEPAQGTPEHQRASAYVNANELFDQPLPFCPATFSTPENRLQRKTNILDATYIDDARAWTTRGAINAGLAVFLFLEEYLVNGRVPKPRFDRCEELGH